MLGLTGFAERIEFLRDGADFGFEGFGRIGEGEGVEAAGFDVDGVDCQHRASLLSVKTIQYECLSEELPR